MPTTVTFAGNTYNIPLAGELNWSSLSNFLVAVANNAGIKSTQVQAVRVATSSPVTVSATSDWAIETNLSVAGAVTVNLPAGVSGQTFFIIDGKGDANTNNITVNGNGGQLINGSASFTIDHARGALYLSFDGTQWVVLDRTLLSGTITSADVASSTGSGAFVLATSPSLTTPNLGTPSAATLTNATGLPIVAGTTGTLSVARGGTGTTTSTGTTNVVLSNSPTLVTPALGTPSSATLTNATGLPLTSGVTGVLPTANGGTGQNSTATFPTSGTVVTETATETLTNKTISDATNTVSVSSNTITGTLATNHGGTGVTSVTTTPTATAFAGWDANKNMSANSFIEGYTTTATAAGTTTLSVTSTEQQYFTGTSTQTVTMPVVSTLVLGQSYTIVNLSTGNVTVQSSGANTIVTLGQNSQAVLTVILVTGTTAASWSSITSTATAGTVTSVAFTGPGGIFGVSGSPVTTSGTISETVTGTSGGVPYFSTTSNLASSGALTANGVVLGGGAGSAPTSTAADSNTAHFLAGGSPPSFTALPAASASAAGTLNFFDSGTIAINTTNVGGFASISGTPGNIVWVRVGNIAYMYIPAFSGTSNSTVFHINLPSSIQPASTTEQDMFYYAARDNSVTDGASTPSIAFVQNPNVYIDLRHGNGGGLWTASGSKGLPQFTTMFWWFCT